MRTAYLILVGCLSLTAAEPAFEVASVKPNHANGPSSGTKCCTPFIVENMPLRSLILMAWRVRDAQLVGGAAWVDQERWDITAKIERDAAGKIRPDLVPAMLTALLKDRFGLVMHAEKRPLNIYVLVAAKSGPKLKRAETAQTSSSSGAMMIRAKAFSMDHLAQALSSTLSMNVSNETGVAGEYDIDLSFAKVNSEDAEHPSIFVALQEQLGLRLEARKAPVDILVIDKAERPGEN